VTAAGGRAAPVTIRPARPGDAVALAEMFGRCSGETRYHRFHGVVHELPPAYLRRCLEPGPDAHAAFVAEQATGGACRLVGLASAGPVGGAFGVREAGVLVEDARQRQGIGRRLLAALSADARASGADLLRLQMCRSQPSLLMYVFAHARVAAVTRDGCDVTIDVAVDVAVDMAGDVPGDLASGVPVDVASGVAIDVTSEVAIDVAGPFPGGPGRAAHGA
jgi:GNAT superfamily N-acetyltransferase